MVFSDPNGPADIESLLDACDLEALHHAAGDEGKLVVDQFGSILVWTAEEFQEFLNG
jgi:hypothetical protein